MTSQHEASYLLVDSIRPPQAMAQTQTVTYRRRQNKSCDQCRFGKRRCDVQVSIQHLREHDPLAIDRSKESETSTIFLHPSPCSNCKKWKKTCTIDWIRSRRSKGTSRVAREVVEHGAYSDWNSHHPPESVDSILGDPLSKSISSDSCQDDFRLASMANASFNNFYLAQQEDPAIPTDSQPYQTAYEYTPLQPMESNLGSIDATQFALEQGFPIGSQSASSYSSDNFGFWGTPISNTQSIAGSQGYEPAPEEPRYSPSLQDYVLLGKTPSPFASHSLAEDHNRLYIKKGLLKIYHDSLEGALSCWLTERNCPYASSPFVDEKDVWSSKWSNRIVTRVRALDEAYSKSGLISKDEQKQASNVLSLVVMAFAVQWAQTSYGNQYGNHKNLSTQLPEHGIFGRNMQKALWHKANMALSQAAGNPSFKIIFAGIILSLTQRPMDSAEVLPMPGAQRQGNLASLRKVLNDDNGPTLLEAAVRKLHDHRRRLKDAECALDKSFSRGQPSLNLGEQDKQTFGLLFWLAVMFDTLSSAMNRRSFALNDGDTKMEDVESTPAPRLSTSLNGFAYDLDGYSDFQTMNSSYLSRESEVWGNYFLRQHSRIGDVRKQTTRWPCSYLDAASCLADAAPVKVLVFRRLGHLQDLYYQQAPAEEIEKAIAATLEVYNHWKITYGLFIGDCVRHHESLPPRIQSWYILLASHWHLAILLLADLVEKMDELHMTLQANRTTRQTTDFAQALRLHSVYAVSDLGRCSRLSDEDHSFSQSPDFHHAVNKAALLTEPWTVVLVRSFAHAGEVLVELVLSKRATGFFMDAVNLAEARSRLDDCIEALWLIGRKSDMALSAAKILQEAVDQG
ncbi:hypothetical protein G647_09982 [Cladophialophora carrionii CBS 160.54]|uniref:Zn(2)-C6 fungal-type domain-containing protein n=1 Tax=Cladophialophora carrionii CBS 160.54 TaxID=1279043 RepID=V9DKR0_9EURO|nr:uncharacterized protein G647_09982 [Cladophialophora carrionii CBS 160.54]ETI26883.1 hypothetical protein G647_09982 [Cladophialophora carrionii CBS 160.54]